MDPEQKTRPLWTTAWERTGYGPGASLVTTALRSEVGNVKMAWPSASAYLESSTLKLSNQSLGDAILNLDRHDSAVPAGRTIRGLALLLYCVLGLSGMTPDPSYHSSDRSVRAPSSKLDIVRSREYGSRLTKTPTSPIMSPLIKITMLRISPTPNPGPPTWGR